MGLAGCLRVALGLGQTGQRDCTSQSLVRLVQRRGFRSREALPATTLATQICVEDLFTGGFGRRIADESQGVLSRGLDGSEMNEQRITEGRIAKPRGWAVVVAVGLHRAGSQCGLKSREGAGVMVVAFLSL